MAQRHAELHAYPSRRHNTYLRCQVASIEGHLEGTARKNTRLWIELRSSTDDVAVLLLCVLCPLLPCLWLLVLCSCQWARCEEVSAVLSFGSCGPTCCPGPESAPAVCWLQGLEGTGWARSTKSEGLTSLRSNTAAPGNQSQEYRCA